MSEDDKEAMAEGIRDLAQRLLNDPVAGPIIQKAGKYKFFSEKEEETVRKFLEKIGAYEKVAPSQDKVYHVMGGAFLPSNIYVIIGLARRVAEGEFTSVNDPAAQQMVRENMIGASGSEVFWIIRDRAISFEDYYEILVELMQAPNLRERIDEYWRVFEETGADLGELHEPTWAVEGIAFRIMRRHGIIKQPDFVSVASMIFSREINVNSKAAVKKLCMNYHQGTSIKGIDYE